MVFGGLGSVHFLKPANRLLLFCAKIAVINIFKNLTVKMYGYTNENKFHCIDNR